MIQRTIAKRYARALLDVSVTERRVRETEAEIQALADLFRTSAAFKTAIVSPVVPRSERKAIAERSLSGRAGASLIRFLQVLIEEGRASLLPEICEVFDTLADAHEGVVRFEVRSATALKPLERERLRAGLQALSGGRHVELSAQADPELIGGIRIRVGDTVIDGTLAGRLKRLKEHLSGLR